MTRIGEPVAKSTLYRHLARMRRVGGELNNWERSKGAFKNVFNSRCFGVQVPADRRRHARPITSPTGSHTTLQQPRTNELGGAYCADHRCHQIVCLQFYCDVMLDTLAYPYCRNLMTTAESICKFCAVRALIATAQVYRTPIDNEEMLRGRILESWRKLRVADCRRAIAQVNDRMLAVVEQDGAQIDHLFRM